MPIRIASLELRVGHVPYDLAVHASDGSGEPLVAGLAPVVDFAQTFNGYAWGGAPHRLGQVVSAVHERWQDDATLPDDLDTLRGCLFLWVRARGHADGASVTVDDAVWVNDLLSAIRRRVVGRG